MAYWSQQEMEKRIAQKRADLISERKELFDKFRSGGWTIQIIDKITAKPEPDAYPFTECDYLVKMPGAASVRVKSIRQLYRLVKGIGK
jgi:hypothetical protein